MTKVITLNVRLNVDGKEQLVTATANLKDLKAAMQGASGKAEVMKQKFIDMAKITVGLKSAQEAIGGLQKSLSALSQSYYNSQEQQTKMTTVMRQRMAATTDEIAATNKLIGAQTGLGVIGGTVQRAGAQQLATFLSTTTSLNTLIPAMNNLVAQQKGLNAETGDAVTVANLMGKAMTGQTGALRKCGIIFTESQEKMLKYGDEQQRAATLAEVITDNVGNMNEALAHTDAGGIKRINNQIGAWKVKLGEIASKAMPALTMATGALNTVLMVMQVQLMGGGLLKWVKSLSFATVAVKIHTAALAAYNVVATACKRVYAFIVTGNLAVGASATVATGGVAALNIALRALLSLTVIGAVFVGIGIAINALWKVMDKSGEESGKVNDGLTEMQRVAKKSQETFAQVASETLAPLQSKYSQLQNAWKNLRTEHEKNRWIKDNQSAFQDLGVNINSVADAEDVFVKNTAKVQDAFKKRAEAAAYAAELVELYKDKIKTEQQIKENNARTTNAYLLKAGDKIDSRHPKFYDILKDEKNTTESVDWMGRHTYTLTKHGEQSLRNLYGTNQLVSSGAYGRGLSSHLNAVNNQIERASANLSKIDTSVQTYTPKTFKPTKTDEPETNTGGHNADSDKDTADHTLKYIDPANTENDYQNNIRYLEDLKAKTEIGTAAYKDLETRIKNVKAELEQRTGKDELIDAPQSVEEYSHNIQILEDRLKKANGTENYKNVSKELEKQKSNLEQFQSVAGKSYNKADLEKLSTLKELDDAISFYQNKLSTAKKEEIQGTQETIQALQEKRKALQSISDLTTMQANTNDIDKKSGKSRQRAIQKVGVQGFTDQINQLEDMKSDGDLTGDQVKQTDKLISTLKRLRKEGATSFDTLKEGWNSVKGIGSGIQSVTDALNGNGNAWQNITGIIDGAIQVYEGISAITGIIDLLTASTRMKTVATVADAAATGTTTAAMGVESGAASVAATAKGPLIAANKAATASYMELASSAFFAAHAAIPFAGFGIAAGFSAASVAMVETIAAMPFAKGGVVSGPTYALVGEYAGASHNPEVIAPLDKLRSMLKPQSEVAGAQIELKLKGRNLVGVLANETRINSVSGRRSNIKS